MEKQRKKKQSRGHVPLVPCWLGTLVWNRVFVKQIPCASFLDVISMRLSVNASASRMFTVLCYSFASYLLPTSLTPPFPQARPLCDSQEILSFLVIRSLIFHPIPELLDATDLLAVVIRDGVGVGLAGWIDTVAFDAFVEISVFL